jgi:hypothetical protein
VALVRRTNVSEEHIASITRVTRLLSLPTSQQGRASQQTAKGASCNMKMEAICFSETSDLVTRATWRHIPENNLLKLFIFISRGPASRVLSCDTNRTFHPLPLQPHSFSTPLGWTLQDRDLGMVNNGSLGSTTPGKSEARFPKMWVDHRGEQRFPSACHQNVCIF